MQAKVWHAKLPTFGLTQQSFPADYQLVATVEAKNLDDVFEKTNHIDREWWLNEGVTAHMQTRSTSVGDVIEMNGKFWRCENAGWQPVVPK